MERCKGFEDWFECLKCPLLCTKLCPIENENVMNEMGKNMRISPVAGVREEKRYFGKSE